MTLAKLRAIVEAFEAPAHPEGVQARTRFLQLAPELLAVAEAAGLNVGPNMPCECEPETNWVCECCCLGRALAALHAKLEGLT